MNSRGDHNLDTQTWFTDRRPTLMLDTPALIRQFVLRPYKLHDVVVRSTVRERQNVELIIRNAVNNFFKEHFGIEEAMKEHAEQRYQSIVHSVSINLKLVNQEKQTGEVIVEDTNIFVPGDVIVDVHTEYIAIELRAYPCQAIQQEHKNETDQRIWKQLAELQQDIQIIETPPVNESMPKRFLDVSVDEVNQKIAQAEAQKQRIYGFWEAVTAFNADYLRHKFADECKDCTYDRTCDNDRCVTFTKYIANFDKRQPELKRVNARLEIKAIFNGLVLRPNGPDANEAPPKAPHTYIYPQEFEDAYTSSDSLTLQESYKDFFAKRLRRNIYHMQEHAVFFKKILGYWPANTLDEKAKDRHAGSTVLCGVSDGLGVYGSSFSNSPRDRGWSEVNFFVIYAGPSRNQLARLVQRILWCGQNRIFLQPDFVQFKRTSLKLREITELIDKHTLGPFSEKWLDNLRIKVEKENNRVRGGTSYRVSRTQNYWNNLRKRIEDLRTVRIVGWQTYDEYVRRIYGPHVGAYAETGNLLDQLELKIARAEESLETRSASKLAHAGTVIAAIGGIGFVGTILAEFASSALVANPGIADADLAKSSILGATLLVIGGYYGLKAITKNEP